METPYTEEGIRKYDHLRPALAAVCAWQTAGPNPEWNARARHAVLAAMPVLARALDRLVAAETGGNTGHHCDRCGIWHPV